MGTFDYDYIDEDELIELKKQRTNENSDIISFNDTSINCLENIYYLITLSKEAIAKCINIQNASHSGTAPDRLFKSFGLAGCGDAQAKPKQDRPHLMDCINIHFATVSLLMGIGKNVSERTNWAKRSLGYPKLYVRDSSLYTREPFTYFCLFAVWTFLHPLSCLFNR